MRIAYLDINCGIAGDMFLGALVDAGCSLDQLSQELSALGIAEEYSISAERVRRGALMGTRVHVDVKDSPRRGQGRHYSDIVGMIRGNRLPEAVKEDAVAVFTLLGEVEARLHGRTLEEIHFHEVGAVDSIVDVVGVCLGLQMMEVAEVYSSPVTDGHGTITCDHGVLPVPAPATLELLIGAPIVSADIPFELVTPTGAALLRHFCKKYGLRPAMVTEAIGYGAGSREIAERPNLLRITIGQALAGHAGSEPGHAHDSAHVHTHEE